jgi:hypothetical protein
MIHGRPTTFAETAALKGCTSVEAASAEASTPPKAAATSAESTAAEAPAERDITGQNAKNGHDPHQDQHAP